MAMFPAFVSVHTPEIMQHVCSGTWLWRGDTPAFGLSTHLIANVLSHPRDGVYVILLPVPSSAVPLITHLHQKGRATCLARNMSLKRILPSHCTTFSHAFKSVQCEFWIIYPQSRPPQLCQATLFNVFASVVTKYGGSMAAPAPALLPYRVQGSHGIFHLGVCTRKGPQGVTAASNLVTARD